jgi:hypothetical protein
MIKYLIGITLIALMLMIGGAAYATTNLPVETDECVDETDDGVDDCAIDEADEIRGRRNLIAARGGRRYDENPEQFAGRGKRNARGGRQLV